MSQRPHTRHSKYGRLFTAGRGKRPTNKLPDGFVVENGILYRQVSPNFRYEFFGDPFKHKIKKVRRI